MFYTYLWLREDGTPYYVGKGKGDRGFTSREHRLNCPPKERIIINYWPDEATAFAYEMYLIDFYGRKDLSTGCLRNLTNGGENPPSWKGKKRSKEQIEKLSKIRKEFRFTQEVKDKMSETRKGKPWTSARYAAVAKLSKE